MKTEQRLKLALSRLSELKERRKMLVEANIPLRHIDEDIEITICILDEILGSYEESVKVFERIKDLKETRIQRRYLDGVNYLLRASNRSIVITSECDYSLGIRIEQHP